MLDEENAVEMIDFMAEGAGEEVFAADFKGFALGVLRPDSYKLRAQDVAAEAGNGEAAFFFALFTFGVNNFGVGKNDFSFGIFPAGYVDHGYAQVQADLGRSESDALRGIHGGEHIFGELLEFGVEILYRRSGLFEDRIAELDDRVDLARSGDCLRRGGLPSLRTRRFVGHNYRNSVASRRESLPQIFAEKHRRAQGQPSLRRRRRRRGRHTSRSARMRLASGSSSPCRGCRGRGAAWRWS